MSKLLAKSKIFGNRKNRSSIASVKRNENLLSSASKQQKFQEFPVKAEKYNVDKSERR